MMNEAVAFDTELAHIYDETRPIDAEACRACFREALQDIARNSHARLVDVGSGTGRVLECLIPDLFQKEQIVGIDISPAMLEVAKSKPRLRGVTFCNVSAVDFASRPENQGHFDGVICHWLFHCLPDWRRAFRACVDMVKPNGVLAWLEEDGDLYRALDWKGTDNHGLNRLFDAYYESVNKEFFALGLENFEPASRAGTALRCRDELKDELAAWGWTVRPCFKAHRWTRRVRVDWLVQTVLALRVFTNLRRIPAIVNSRAIENLRSKLGHSGLPNPSDEVALNFWANGVKAAKGISALPQASVEAKRHAMAGRM
jgi:SAM-dependent methyltransferase